MIIVLEVDFEPSQRFIYIIAFSISNTIITYLQLDLLQKICRYSVFYASLKFHIYFRLISALNISLHSIIDITTQNLTLNLNIVYF